MTTPAQTTLLHAAELLEDDAKWLLRYHNADPDHPTWSSIPITHAVHDDLLTTALELRLLARSIKVDHIPDAGKMVSTVPPAPTFKEK